jgi:thiol-disulfide isomerase/thioredoxin
MKVIAYHFWSPTCQPCKVVKPVIEDLKEEFPTVEWISVNTHDDKMEYSKKFDVFVVPTVVVTVQDDMSRVVNMEKHSGTTAAMYYKILRNAIKIVQG